MPNWLQLQTLKTKLLSDPYYRLQSTEEITAAVALGIQIDVNQASVDDWLRLPGLSIRQARVLVELCRSGVHFYCLEDIAAALSMPVGRLKPLEPILEFCYYDEEAACISQLINPNTATIEQLAKIPFVDLSLAEAVVQNRTSNGPYRHLVDFQKRLSLDAQMISKLMHYLHF